MKMFRNVLMLMATLLLLTVLIGCGGGGGSSDPVEEPDLAMAQPGSSHEVLAMFDGQELCTYKVIEDKEKPVPGYLVYNYQGEAAAKDEPVEEEIYIQDTKTHNVYKAFFEDNELDSYIMVCPGNLEKYAGTTIEGKQQEYAGDNVKVDLQIGTLEQKTIGKTSYSGYTVTEVWYYDGEPVTTSEYFWSVDTGTWVSEKY